MVVQILKHKSCYDLIFEIDSREHGFEFIKLQMLYQSSDCLHYYFRLSIVSGEYDALHFAGLHIDGNKNEFEPLSLQIFDRVPVDVVAKEVSNLK